MKEKVTSKQSARRATFHGGGGGSLLSQRAARAIGAEPDQIVRTQHSPDMLQWTFRACESIGIQSVINSRDVRSRCWGSRVGCVCGGRRWRMLT